MTDSIDPEGFRANVGIVLIRDDRQVFLGGRTGGRGWQFPQGGVRRDESPEQALFRELKEEIGLELDHVEIFWARSFKRPKQIEILFRAITSAEPKTQSAEVEKAIWYALDALPSGLPSDQKLLIERAVENWRV